MNFASLPFDEAIKYFRQKVNLPTERWTSIMDGAHARAFVVAGAMKSELLSDLRQAIDKGISEGTTITAFRKAFDETVKKNGWNYKGKRGWRTSVIFNTNMMTSYAEGHYKQMTEPAVLKERPFWRYMGGLSEHPRPLHLSWNGLVLSADDPWWKAHYPVKEFGCKCQVVSHSHAELVRDGLRVADKAPNDGNYDWTNPETGEVVSIPKGVGPGFNYPTGKAAWGERLSDKAMSSWRAQGAKAYESLTPGTWETYGRPDRVPVDATETMVGKKIAARDIEAEVEKILGAKERVYSFIAEAFRYDVLVNAKTLAAHIDPSRDRYLPFLPETMTDPYEVWFSFERHRGTGKVVLRQRIIKAISTGEKEGMLVVTNAVNGVMEAWTVIPVGSEEYINRQRIGKLIWKR